MSWWEWRNRKIACSRVAVAWCWGLNTSGWRSLPAAHAPNMASRCTWRTAVECVSQHRRDDARSVACGGMRS